MQVSESAHNESLRLLCKIRVIVELSYKMLSYRLRFEAGKFLNTTPNL
jgi:hypothetical protein